MLASKFFDDVYYNNAYYARVGGISNIEARPNKIILTSYFLHPTSYTYLTSHHLTPDHLTPYFHHFASTTLLPTTYPYHYPYPYPIPTPAPNPYPSPGQLA